MVPQAGLGNVLDTDLGDAEDVLIFRFVEIGGGSALGGFDGLEFHKGTAFGQVHVHFLDVTVLLEVLMQRPNVVVLLGKVQNDNAVALHLFSCQLGR
jgi:hypothetical protein